MGIQRGVAITMLNFNCFAIAAFGAHEYDSPVTCSTDTCSCGCTVVDAFVWSDGIQNRVFTCRVKARCNACFDRVAQELFFKALSVCVKVCPLPAANMAECTIGRITGTILGSQDVAVLHFLTFFDEAFVQHSNLITDAYFPVEVDGPLKDRVQFHDH